MAFFLYKVLVLVLVLSAQAQDPKEEYAETELQVLNEVTFYECAPDKVPCEPGRADIGCVPAGMSKQAFDKACSKYYEVRREFNYDCYLISASGRKIFFGQTETVFG